MIVRLISRTPKGTNRGFPTVYVNPLYAGYQSGHVGVGKTHAEAIVNTVKALTAKKKI